MEGEIQKSKSVRRLMDTWMNPIKKGLH
jgi:hypothetical protein